MVRLNCVVLAISCALIAPPCFGAPAAVVEVPTEEDTGINNSAQNSQLTINDLVTAIRNKRQTEGSTTTPREGGKCQENGGYCRYHEDCCSQLCLSFSYKCVTRPPQSQFTPVISDGQNAGAQVGFEDVVNRFGDSNTGTGTSANGSAAGPTPTCAAVGGYCQRSSDCCSRTCLSFSYKCINNVNTPFNRPPSHSSSASFGNNVFEVGHPIPSPDNAITIEELVNRFGAGQEDNTLSTNSVLPAVTNTPRPQTSISSGTGTTLVQIPVALQPPVVQSGPQCIGNGGQCQSSNQCCTGLCVQLSSNNQFCAERVQQTTGATTTLPTSSGPTAIFTIQSSDCLPIGGKVSGDGDLTVSLKSPFINNNSGNPFSATLTPNAVVHAVTCSFTSA